MPRPGPRSYECVRRAWHSDAHQVLRGTITQEILRIVTDLHKEDTRNKKEWQEQLPNVVLKAEEIMYSKARSEEDYSDLNTLRGRLDDAVNTIIRVTDEVDSHPSNKDEPFLEPCIEAALLLACSSKVSSKGGRSATTSKRVLNMSDTIFSKNRPFDHMVMHQTHASMSRSSSRTGVSSSVPGRWGYSGNSSNMPGSDTLHQFLAYNSSSSSNGYSMSSSASGVINSSSAGSSSSSLEKDELQLCLGLPQPRDDIPSNKKQKNNHFLLRL